MAKQKISPLYARFNGFCLGAFLAGAQQALGAARYGEIRRRVHEFLDEIEIGNRLPRQHAVFVTSYQSLMANLMRELRSRDRDLHTICGVGAMAVLFAGSYVGTSRYQRTMLRERWQPVLTDLGLGPQAFEGYVRGLSRAARTHNLSGLVSQSYLLLTDLLQPLPAEVDICFVAMPFKKPYADYYMHWYRPALQIAGFRAIRAWGGLGEEEYYPFIAPLIARSASVLAELSAGNLNVANEVGLAHGANCPTFLLIRDGIAPPSNLADLLILRYAPRTPGWPQNDIARLARYIRVQWRAYERSITHESLIHATAHRLLQILLAAGHPVPRSIRTLAGVVGSENSDSSLSGDSDLLGNQAEASGRTPAGDSSGRGKDD